MRPRGERLRWVVYALTVANVATLWWARGDYVPGLDLFGASAGVLVLAEDGFLGAAQRFGSALLSQRHRVISTADESFLYGLVPGLLNGVVPWLLWSHLFGLTLFVASVAWVAHRLRLDPVAVCACILASPALVSFSIVGFPFLASAALPFSLSLGYVFGPARERSGLMASLRDVIAFGFITFLAFNGYQSGQVFFVVPALAALTLPGVRWPRRSSWLVCAAAIGWLVWTNQPAPTHAALAAIPSDPIQAIREGVQRVAQRYFADWYLDFPALFLAAVVALVVLERERLFWASMLGVLVGLCSLSAFQFGGQLLGPRRFLPLFLVAALAVAKAISQPGGRGVLRSTAIALVIVGMSYTTYRTVRFARAEWPNQERRYSLPYAYSGVDMQIWHDRIHDAGVLVDRLRAGDERHVLFYGFSVSAEDSVNPQLFVSRLLLPLGYRRFHDAVWFFDHQDHNLIRLPFSVRPLSTVEPVLRSMQVPFYVHVKVPEYSGSSIVARYLNGATIVPVDLGLIDFRSYRVTAYAPPGPIPIQPLDDRVRARITSEATDLADGFCLTTWKQESAGHSPLRHWSQLLPTHLDILLRRAAAKADPALFADVERRRVPELRVAVAPSHVAHLVAYFDNRTGVPMRANLVTRAGDEIGVVLNGQVLIEMLGLHSRSRWEQPVLLPPGMNELQVLSHRFWQPGTVSLHSAGPDGEPLRWQCPAGFGAPLGVVGAGGLR